MAEMSARFNFDDFDAQIAEALEQNDEAMAQVRPLRPGALGAVSVLGYRAEVDAQTDPEPPEAA